MIEGESVLRETPIPILPGQYFDAETGLYQNWHRDYDPSIGRYLQADPIKGLDGVPADSDLTAQALKLLVSGHSYAYADLNPLRFIDFLGLASDAPINGPNIPYTGPEDEPLEPVYPELIIIPALKGAQKGAQVCKTALKDPCNVALTVEVSGCLSAGFGGADTAVTEACLRKALVRYRICRNWGGGGLVK